MLVKFRAHLAKNVVGYIALFFALGSSSYAAITVTGKNVKNSSLTGKDVRDNSMTGKDVKGLASADVKDFSLVAKDFKAGQLPAGPRGATGATGPAGPFPGVLPSGKTLRGAYDVQGTAAGAGSVAEAGYPFIFTLASKPAVHYIPSSGTPPAQCPGTNDQPEAQPGHLCVYENVRANTPSVLVADPETNTGGGSSEEGFYLQIVSSAGGFFSSDGTWAVTSP